MRRGTSGWGSWRRRRRRRRQREGEARTQQRVLRAALATTITASTTTTASTPLTQVRTSIKSTALAELTLGLESRTKNVFTTSTWNSCFCCCHHQRKKRVREQIIQRAIEKHRANLFWYWYTTVSKRSLFQGPGGPQNWYEFWFGHPKCHFWYPPGPQVLEIRTLF